MARNVPNPGYSLRPKNRKNREVILRLTTNLSDEKMSELLAEFTGVTRVEPAVAKPVYSRATWRTKKERKAAKGFACTVPGEDCGRRDLRTPHNTGSHTDFPNAHSPKKKPLHA